MSAMESQVSEASELDSEFDQDDDDDQIDYYNNDDSDDDEFLSRSQSKIDPESYSYKCMNYKEVWSFLQEEILSLSTRLHLEYSNSLAALQYYKWDVETIEQKILMDRNELLKEIHILPQDTNNPTPPVQDDNDCEVCSSPSGAIVVNCRHTFCTDCWQTYLTLQVKDGKSLGIECMKCDVLVSMETVEKLLKPLDDIYTRYCYLKVTDVVMSHRLLRWCPGIDCNIVFIIEELPQAKRVTCTSCKASSCFLCGEEYHCPTECEAFKNWQLKCQDDSETFNYISANTKDCPKCRASIEKNGGCNHIKCSLCSHDFCWMCLEDWSKHNGEYYECSRYKADPDKYKDKAAKERIALHKYLFYYERWKNHHQSLLLEEETLKKIQEHIEKRVGACEGTWIDWQYLMDAASLLRKSRYTLKYTYPRAYWMEGDKKQLFEYQQAQLELEIENLSWKVERATITDRADLEQQMAVTEVRRITLLRDFTV